MVKLKQIRLVPYAIVVTTLLFFSACVDKSYNLDDDNLDKTGVISPDGGTVPLGSVDEINVYDQLVKQFTGNNDVIFSYDPDGALFIQYNGDFNIDMPSIEPPTIDPISIPTVNDIPGIPKNSTLQTLPLLPGASIPVAKDGITYQMDEPVSSGTNWSIEINSVDFNACDIIVTINFGGISFGGTDPGKLLVSLELPPNIVPVDNRVLTEEVDLLKNPNINNYTFPAIKVKRYDYASDAQIKYDVSLEVGKEIIVTTQNSVSFDMTFKTTGIDPSLFRGKASVKIEDSINDFNTFFDSFKDDVLNLDNPAMGIEINTNIGAKFNLNVNSLTAVNKDGETSIGGASLVLAKPNPPIGVTNFVDTKYWLSPKEENVPAGWQFKTMAIDELINARPSGIKYDLDLKTADGPDDVAEFFVKDMNITGKYTLKLPFSFTKMNITVSDTIMNVFTKDLYDNFFKDAGADDYLEIRADSVDIHFPGAAANSVTLNVIANILKDDGTRLDGVTFKSDPITNGNVGDNPLVIQIKGLKSMEDARHLELSFSADAKSLLKLTKDDYIQIGRLKFSTNRGYHFNF